MFHTKRHINMGDFYKKGQKTKWEGSHDDTPPKKEQRTSSTTNQFLLFCDFILTYEKYKPYKEEMNDDAYSPGSSDRASDCFSSESNSSFNHNEPTSEDAKNSDTDTDENDLITCYCMKPFANRPMIECSVCQTWLHMSCAIVRPNNIPEYFVCQMCQDAKSNRRRSSRIKGTFRRFLQHA